MEQLLIAVTWATKWELKKQAWQRWYGSTVGTPGRTHTTILADCEENRRLFVRGVI